MLTALVSNNVAAGVGRYCGRLLGLTQATVSHTVCCKSNIIGCVLEHPTFLRIELAM